MYTYLSGLLLEALCLDSAQAHFEHRSAFVVWFLNIFFPKGDTASLVCLYLTYNRSESN